MWSLTPGGWLYQVVGSTGLTVNYKKQISLKLYNTDYGPSYNLIYFGADKTLLVGRCF